MLLEFLRLVLGVEDGQLCEHSHVGSLQTQRRLQQTHQLLEVTPVLQVEKQMSQRRVTHKSDLSCVQSGQGFFVFAFLELSFLKI